MDSRVVFRRQASSAWVGSCSAPSVPLARSSQAQTRALIGWMDCNSCQPSKSQTWALVVRANCSTSSGNCTSSSAWGRSSRATVVAELVATQVSAMGFGASRVWWPKLSCVETLSSATSLPSSVASMACTLPCKTTPSPSKAPPAITSRLRKWCNCICAAAYCRAGVDALAKSRQGARVMVAIAMRVFG